MLPPVALHLARRGQSPTGVPYTIRALEHPQLVDPHSPRVLEQTVVVETDCLWSVAVVRQRKPAACGQNNLDETMVSERPHVASRSHSTHLDDVGAGVGGIPPLAESSGVELEERSVRDGELDVPPGALECLGVCRELDVGRVEAA